MYAAEFVACSQLQTVLNKFSENNVQSFLNALAFLTLMMLKNMAW